MTRYRHLITEDNRKWWTLGAMCFALFMIMLDNTPPRPDGIEMTAAAWYRPAEALAAHAAGELPLAFPTRSQLMMLRSFRTSDEAIAAHRDRAPEPTLPKILGEGESRRIVLPGEPGYDD